MEPDRPAANPDRLDRHEVEEERPFRFRGDRFHLAPNISGQALVDVDEIRGLAAQAGAVVDDLGVDLTIRDVDQRHGGGPGVTCRASERRAQGT